ncbi:hypothetical protein KUTeg_007481 [Tegillarca granosa]|uniref:SH3 domain-containing protein n=1 Tax=Tegillarca granosa TaxID=220873 RepID=A0ABQ9FFD1_TEGGR|nr:hypothetical protein KUTeg_007481 [Tegillarca granosa]
MVECLVEFDYDAEQEDELTIRVGDIIKNVKQEEGGWWEGELNGKKGLFPDNFVIEKKQEKADRKEEFKKEAVVKGQPRSSVKDLANKLKDVHLGSAPPKKKEPPLAKKKAKVTFSYEPENDDELKLEVGEIVEILKQEEEGWWEGSLNGKIGMFPSNFVEIVDEAAVETEKTDTTPEDKGKDAHEVKGKKVIGVGLGNIFGDGPIKLRPTAGSKKEQPPPEPEQPAPVMRREKPMMCPQKVDDVERALVRYSYTAENEDELTLKENEIVIILDKELEDVGWWKGEVNGKVGVFPDNFVELIDEPKPKKPPPPSVSASSQKTAPKLPDKAPVADAVHREKSPPVSEPAHAEKHVKKKDHPDVSTTTTTTEKHAPPLITSKKPSVPPPVGRKPAKPEPPRPSMTTDHKVTTTTTTSSLSSHHKDEPLPKAPQHHHSKEELHKDTTSHVNKDSADHFDSVEVASEKLTHLTANRAKGPSKRPPSQVLSMNKGSQLSVKEEERNGDVKDTHWLKEEKPHLRTSHPTHKDIKEETSVKDRYHSTPPARPPEPSPGNASILAAIDELKKEIRELKANSVSKAQYEDLKSENERLKHEIETIKHSHSRKFKDLMLEVDEEKKIRLITYNKNLNIVILVFSIYIYIYILPFLIQNIYIYFLSFLWRRVKLFKNRAFISSKICKYTYFVKSYKLIKKNVFKLSENSSQTESNNNYNINSCSDLGEKNYTGTLFFVHYANLFVYKELFFYFLIDIVQIIEQQNTVADYSFKTVKIVLQLNTTHFTSESNGFHWKFKTTYC